MCAVTVAVSMPMPSPDTTRATISPGSSGKVMKITAETISRPMAGSRIRRLPSVSPRCPARNRLMITPTAYAAKAIVMANVEKPSRSW